MTCFCWCLCDLHYGITCFFRQVQKIIREMACLLLSFGSGANRFALFFGDFIIFFLWFNLLEFVWIFFYRKKTKKFRQNLILQSSDASIIENHHSLKQGAIFTKYRKSNIFNTAYLFNYCLSFSNHNDKISLLSS